MLSWQKIGELKCRYPSDRLERIKDYRKYAACVRDMEQKGRLEIEGLIQEHGARVVQALAARILTKRWQFEKKEIELAEQIPMPLLSIAEHINWHRAHIQWEFLRLVESL